MWVLFDNISQYTQRHPKLCLNVLSLLELHRLILLIRHRVGVFLSSTKKSTRRFFYENGNGFKGNLVFEEEKDYI